MYQITTRQFNDQDKYLIKQKVKVQSKSNKLSKYLTNFKFNPVEY